MIQPLEEMPAGTIGFRAGGRVTRDDYRDVLAPALRTAAEAGEVRLVFVIGPDFDKFEAGALFEDSKLGVGLGIEHFRAWRRTALVTDVEWIAHTVNLLGWLTPGDVKMFPLGQEDAAKAWAAEG